jgi:tetratricopeptide repeat protein
MAYVWVRSVLFAVAALACCKAVNAQQQEIPPPPVLPTLSPPVPPPWILAPRPDPLPSPPDAPVPDLGSLPSADKSKSRLKHTIDRLTPRCLDAATHTCWSSPPGDQPQYAADEDRQFAKDMEVGEFNLKDKNYRGAELRFRDALSHKPDSPDATFKLAQALDKLGKNEDAITGYKSYLAVQSKGPFAPPAQKALDRLERKAPEKK